VRNPIRSEAEAFRFLILTIAAFTAIVVATSLWGWVAGVLVWLLVTVAAIVFYFREPSVEPRVRQSPAPHDPGEYRVVVLANETVASGELFDEVCRVCKARSARVLVVAPALRDRTHTWTSDVDPARADAQARLDVSLANLAEAGIAATGEVGAGDPLTALDDALRTFGPDEAIISTRPSGRSNWLERDVVAKARERFDLPITHVIVEDVA
jgi:GABA permease